MKKYLILFILISQSLFSKALGTFGSWTAYEIEIGKNKMCYMATTPIKSEGNYKKRDASVLMVTHDKSTKAYDIISFTAGFNYKAGSVPTAQIDKNKPQKLDVQEDTAWMSDKMISAMKNGNRLVLNGVSKRGTKIKDTISLKGFTKAYQAISKACK